MQEIDKLRDRARKFRRNAEWMINGRDRNRIIAEADALDARAFVLAADRRLAAVA